jgi:hypothetical protein
MINQKMTNGGVTELANVTIVHPRDTGSNQIFSCSVCAIFEFKSVGCLLTLENYLLIHMYIDQ